MSPSLRNALVCWLLLLAAACSAKVRPVQESGAGQAAPVEVLVVPLQGVLGTQEIALCHRALREAAANGMRVVFKLDTAGGIGESTGDVQGLLDHVQNGKVATMAVVQGSTKGGAAYLALLCDQLLFLRSGDLGDIAPIPTTLEELLALGDDSAERVRLRAYAEELRARLERRKTKLRTDALRLCEGMADPGLQLVRARVRERGIDSNRVLDATEVAALQAAGNTVLDQTPVTRPVVLEAAEAEAIGLSQGIVQSIDQLCTDVLMVDRRLVGELQFSWSEHMVGWLELLQPALLLLGFVLLLIEVKTPGIGLPGLLGTAFLALAMFYSYLVGMAEVGEILLFFLGIASLAVEIFLLPGMVVFGAVGFLCLVFSLILSRQTFVLPSNVTQEEILFHNLLHLTILFVAVIVVAMAFWRVLPRVPLLRRMYLAAPGGTGGSGGAGGQVAAAAPSPLLGRTARAATVLRPAGAIELDGDRLDVVTAGEFVEAGRQVRIVEVLGNRIVVEPVPAGDGERGSVGLVLLLVLVGVLLLVAEVFFVSFGVLFLLSGCALFGALFLAFQESVAFGWSMLVTEALLAPLTLWGAFRLLPKTAFGRALMLDGPRPQEVSGTAMDPELRSFLHQTGVTVSALRPAGFARIGGRKVDVVTRGEMLDQGCTVRVIEVSGNRVVVRADGGAP